jgi:hypothetical protein
MLPFPNNSVYQYINVPFFHESKWDFQNKLIMTRLLGIFYIHVNILSFNACSATLKFKGFYLWNIKLPDFIIGYFLRERIVQEYDESFSDFKLVQSKDGDKVQFNLNLKFKQNSKLDNTYQCQLGVDIFETTQFIKSIDVNPRVMNLALQKSDCTC